jgi:hypothetical protein
VKYKFVECPVEAEAIEDAVNGWVERGWTFEGLRFPGDGRALVSFFKEAGKRIDLGEIDLGEAEPLSVELDHAKKKRVARKRR